MKTYRALNDLSLCILELFIADRDLQGDSAIYTRQNEDGDRSGFECAEVYYLTFYVHEIDFY